MLGRKLRILWVLCLVSAALITVFLYLAPAESFSVHFGSNRKVASGATKTDLLLGHAVLTVLVVVLGPFMAFFHPQRHVSAGKRREGRVAIEILLLVYGVYLVALAGLLAAGWEGPVASMPLWLGAVVVGASALALGIFVMNRRHHAHSARGDG